MPKLIIQIDSSVAQDSFSWLAKLVPPRLEALNLGAEIFVNPKVMPVPTHPLSDSQIHGFAQERIDHSGLRQQADDQQDWYIHIFITTAHINNLLGVMYDYGFDERARQGCAVFWKPIRELSSSRVDFEKVMLRTVLHEIGHCLNLGHQSDGTLMTQTGEIQGPGWINHINYHYTDEEVHSIRFFPSSHKPGTLRADFGRSDDQKNYGKTLKLSLKSYSKKKLTVGDPFSILATITNKGSEDIEILLPQDPTSNNIRIWLKVPGKKYRFIKKIINGCGTSVEKITFIKKSELIFPLHLFADSMGYLFKVPGKYWIKVEIQIKEGKWLYGKRLSFEVEPLKDDDTAVTAAVYSPEFIKFITLNGTENKSTKRLVNSIIKEKPESALSRTLGWNLIYEFKDKLRYTNMPIEQQKLSRQLLRSYKQLLKSESSKVRKGKILLECEKLSQFLGQRLKKRSKMDAENIQRYQALEIKLIKRPKIEKLS